MDTPDQPTLAELLTAPPFHGPAGDEAAMTALRTEADMRLAEEAWADLGDALAGLAAAVQVAEQQRTRALVNAPYEIFHAYGVCVWANHLRGTLTVSASGLRTLQAIANPLSGGTVIEWGSLPVEAAPDWTCEPDAVALARAAARVRRTWTRPARSVLRFLARITHRTDGVR